MIDEVRPKLHVVIDTNVIVSGLLRPYSTSADILRLVVHRSIRLLYDARILGEYREVLLRPKFRLNRAYVDTLLDYFKIEGILIAGQPLSSVLPDPDDAPFLEVAISGEADALITGNRRHFPEESHGNVRICSPSEFLSGFFPAKKR